MSNPVELYTIMHKIRVGCEIHNLRWDATNTEWTNDWESAAYFVTLDQAQAYIHVHLSKENCLPQLVTFPDETRFQIHT